MENKDAVLISRLTTGEKDKATMYANLLGMKLSQYSRIALAGMDAMLDAIRAGGVADIRERVAELSEASGESAGEIVPHLFTFWTEDSDGQFRAILDKLHESASARLSRREPAATFTDPAATAFSDRLTRRQAEIAAADAGLKPTNRHERAAAHFTQAVEELSRLDPMGAAVWYAGQQSQQPADSVAVEKFGQLVAAKQAAIKRTRPDATDAEAFTQSLEQAAAEDKAGSRVWLAASDAQQRRQAQGKNINAPLDDGWPITPASRDLGTQAIVTGTDGTLSDGQLGRSALGRRVVVRRDNLLRAEPRTSRRDAYAAAFNIEIAETTASELAEFEASCGGVVVG